MEIDQSLQIPLTTIIRVSIDAPLPALSHIFPDPFPVSPFEESVVINPACVEFARQISSTYLFTPGSSRRRNVRPQSAVMSTSPVTNARLKIRGRWTRSRRMCRSAEYILPRINDTYDDPNVYLSTVVQIHKNFTAGW